MLTGSTIKKELNELKKTEHKLRNMIDAGPEGSLYYRRSRSGKREDIPYLRIGRGAKYRTKSLSGADPGYLGALKRKTYALHLLPFIRARRKMLEKAAGYAPVPGHIKNYGGEPFRDCYEEVFGKVPGNPAFEALQERQNPEYRDELKFMTALGTFRSKNEALFADRLDSLSLHFKYETPLDIEMYRYFPDFVVLHPKTGNALHGRSSSTQSTASIWESISSSLLSIRKMDWIWRKSNGS